MHHDDTHSFPFRYGTYHISCQQKWSVLVRFEHWQRYGKLGLEITMEEQKMYGHDGEYFFSKKISAILLAGPIL